jgi:hypothetical protein
MKKYFISFAFVAAIAGASAWSFTQNKSGEVVSDMALANVEALAQSEGEGSGCRLSLLYICSTSNADHYLYRNN